MGQHGTLTTGLVFTLCLALLGCTGFLIVHSTWLASVNLVHGHLAAALYNAIVAFVSGWLLMLWVASLVNDDTSA